jgi:hypothetical protein
MRSHTRSRPPQVQCLFACSSPAVALRTVRSSLALSNPMQSQSSCTSQHNLATISKDCKIPATAMASLEARNAMLVQHHHHRSTTHSLDHAAALAQRASCCLTCSVALPRLHPPWKRAVYSIVVAGCTTSRNNFTHGTTGQHGDVCVRWWMTGLPRVRGHWQWCMTDVSRVQGHWPWWLTGLPRVHGHWQCNGTTLNGQQAHELRIRRSYEPHSARGHADTHRCTWRKHGEVGRSDRARRDLSGHWAS